eukprot:NODE_141_length_17903_cov_0.288643.p9 type:complete len:164 gc:universal NODE_141_length_17903_cov_0.288643:15756-16247(+)
MTQETFYSFTEVRLFGESIAVELPAYYYSVAQVRQIPDNQEVYVFENDSIVIELLESAEGNTATSAISFHFDVIKEDNEATESKAELVEEIYAPILSNGGFGAVLMGKQIVNGIEIDMGITLIRLNNIETDIVITWHSKNVNRNDLLHLAETLRIENWGLFQD